MSSVVVSTVSSVNELASAFLGVCENSLATTIGGVPELSYLYPVEPVIDCCPSLIVYVASLSEETTSPISPPAATGHRASYGRLNLVGLTAWILRCAPAVNEDGSIRLEDIADVAEVLNEDSWALWNGIYQAVNDGTFMDICSDVHFDRAAPIREQGGCLGWQFSIRAELGGIPYPLGT